MYKFAAPETLFGLLKAVEKKVRPLTLDPGVYDLEQEITLSLTGQISKDHDVQEIPKRKADPDFVLAVALKLAGVSREKAKRLAVQAIEICCSEDPTAAEAIAERIADVVDAGEIARRSLPLLAPRVKSGTLRAGSVAIEILHL